MAGGGYPAWLTHKIDSHPEAGKEVWVTPAKVIAGCRKPNPRESNKRRKAISTLGHTLIIPTVTHQRDPNSEQPDRGGELQRHASRNWEHRMTCNIGQE